jgi:hypothetical protein
VLDSAGLDALQAAPVLEMLDLFQYLIFFAKKRKTVEDERCSPSSS